MDQSDILVASMQTATVYAILNILIWIAYPTFTSFLWQKYIGRYVEQHWPTYVQANDVTRYSFLIPNSKMVVLKISFMTAPIFEAIRWLRDGFLIGVLFCLLGYQIMSMILVSFIMFWLFFRMIILGFSPRNFIFVDIAFASIKSGLMLGSLVYALSFAQLLTAI